MSKAFYIGVILLLYTLVKFMSVRTQIKKVNKFASVDFEKLSVKDRESTAGMIYSFYINFSAVAAILIIIGSLLFKFNEKTIFGIAIAVFFLDIVFKNFILTGYYERKTLSIGNSKVMSLKALKKDENVNELLILKSSYDEISHLYSRDVINESPIILKWLNQLTLMELILENNINVLNKNSLVNKTYNDILTENDCNTIEKVIFDVAKKTATQVREEIFIEDTVDNILKGLKIYTRFIERFDIYSDEYIIKGDFPKIFNSCGFQIFSNLDKDLIVPYPLDKYCAYIEYSESECFVIVTSLESSKQYVNYYTGDIESCNNFKGNFSNYNQYIEWLIRYCI